MISTLDLLLSKRQDYLDYEQKCKDLRSTRQVLADEKIEKLFEDFTEKLHDCIQKSNTPSILVPFRYMRSIKYVYNEREFFEILTQRLQKELPTCLTVQNIYMSKHEHPVYGLIESACVCLEPTVKII